MNILQKRLCYLLIIAYPIFYLGIGNKYPWALLGKNGVNIGMIVFFILTFLFIASGILFKLENISIEKLKIIFKLNLILALFFIILYDFIQYHHFKSFGYQNPILLYITDLFFIFVLISISKESNLHFKLISFFVILHTIFSIYYFPLTIQRSDMFGAITTAIHQFINNLDPYKKVFLNVGIPRYFPLTILSFIPAYFTHSDPRITGLCYTLILLCLINKKISKLQIVNQFAICLVFLNPYWMMRHDLYFQLFLIEITLLYIYKMNNFFRIILFSITLATSQLAIILFPFLCLAYNKTITKAFKSGFIAFVITAIIIYAFAHNDLKSFTSAITMSASYIEPYSSDITFGLAPIFHFAKNQISLYIIQIFGCLTILTYALYQFIVKKVHDNKFYIACGTICYFYFMVTNYFLETYLYIPLILALALTNSKKD